MNNHTHMLVKTMQIENLSKYMQRLNIKYAKYYNNKYNRVEYVFEIDINQKEFMMKNIYLWI